MDIEKLKDALTRHFIEIQKGNYDDDWLEFWHFYSLADNCMMIIFQLKQKDAN
jgi:hypothetical protein